MSSTEEIAETESETGWTELEKILETTSGGDWTELEKILMDGEPTEMSFEAENNVDRER